MTAWTTETLISLLLASLPTRSSLHHQTVCFVLENLSVLRNSWKSSTWGYWTEFCCCPSFLLWCFSLNPLLSGPQKSIASSSRFYSDCLNISCQWSSSLRVQKVPQTSVEKLQLRMSGPKKTPTCQNTRSCQIKTTFFLRNIRYSLVKTVIVV